LVFIYHQHINYNACISFCDCYNEGVRISVHYNTDKQKDSFWKRILISFIGFSKKEKHPDLWYSTILGTIESFVFPVLMKAELFSAIGAWIALKTVSQWKLWDENRSVFGRFLIAHSLLLLICFLCY